MIWIITVYLFCSAAIAVAAWVSGGFLAGLSAGAAALLALTAAVSVKFGVLRGDRQQLVGIAVAASVVLGLSYLLSLNFSIQLFGARLSGFQWALAGVIVGFICVTKQMIAE